jgi:hypothetical protein
MKILIIAVVLLIVFHKLTDNKIREKQRKRRDELLRASEERWTLQDEINRGKR